MQHVQTADALAQPSSRSRKRIVVLLLALLLSFGAAAGAWKY